MATDKSQDFNKKAKKPLGELPRWNFENFYPATDSDEFNNDWARLEAMADDFVSAYEGKVDGLKPAALAKSIEDAKAIEALAGKLMTYAQLKQTQDSKAYGAFLAGLDKKAGVLEAKMAFYNDELKKLDQGTLDKALKKSKKLRKYEPWINDVRRAIPHTPELSVQQYMGELNPASYWVKLYDDRSVSLRYTVDGEEMTVTQLMSIIMSDPDREKRSAAHAEYIRVMNENDWLWEAVHNALIGMTDTNDRWQNFENPWDARHLSNNVAPEVVDALEQAVKDSYERVSHRFYALKAKLMGLEKLELWDRNVNVFSADDERKIPYEEARDMVLDAYREFSPEIADVAQKFFDNGWIDAPVEPNKSSGAFAHPGGAYLAHPMVMLNYQGTAGDVKTMAHELGHGVHQYLAAHKGDAIVETPLTLAETASVFGEMLTFKSLMRAAENDDERRKLLFDKVNSMINTVVRQISFYDFEKRNHMLYAEKQQPLTKEEFAANWLDVSRESLGPAMNINDDYGAVYGYIPHLIHTPFYVYAYAFGDALTNALYAAYEEGNIEDFESKYITMLEKGGTLTFEDLNEMFGLDVSDPGFWKKGLDVMESFMDELEEMCKPLLEKDAASAPAAPTPKA